MALTSFSVEATPTSFQLGVREPVRPAGLTWAGHLSFGRSYVQDFRDATRPSVAFLSSGDVFSSWPDPEEQLRRQLDAINLVRTNLAPLRALPVGWDSYGGHPTETGPARFAEELVTMLMIQDVEPPEFMPLPGGGLRLEWFGTSEYLVIRIPGTLDDGPAVSAYFSDEQTGQEWEADYDSVRSDELPDALSRFVRIGQ